MKQKKTKRTYRLRNWKQYNPALVRRGSLTLWVSEDVIAAWNEPPRTGRRGKPATYADALILCMASLQEIYHLPLRATEGLLASVVHLLGVSVGGARSHDALSAQKSLGGQLAAPPKA